MTQNMYLACWMRDHELPKIGLFSTTIGAFSTDLLTTDSELATLQPGQRRHDLRFDMKNSNGDRRC